MDALGASPSGRPWSPPPRRLVVGVLVGLLGPVAVALGLGPLREGIDGALIGLLLLVPTALAAAVGGPLAAVTAVAAGSLTHNAVFTVPLWTLRVSEPSELTALAVHTLVAATISFVVVREQRAAALAAERQDASDRLRVLEEVDQARTALLGAVSHDLRTPLAAIAAAATDLQDGGVTFSDEQRDVLLDTIVERASSLDRTVGNLLDASRLHVGAITLAAEAVELQDLADEAIAAAGAAGDRIRVVISPSTPPVLVDPVLVVAALRNLVENAVRHTPPASPITIEASRAGDVVTVSVTDAGPGLDGDVTELFEAFRGRSGGPGLGLTIARGFVELHGGELTYSPGLESGAVFEFSLPAVEEPEA